MPAGEGIKTTEDDLLFGLREFQLQQRLFERARGRLGIAHRASPGLVLRYQSSGLPDATWTIDDSDDDGSAVVRSVSGGVQVAAGITDRAYDQHGVAIAYDPDGVPFSFDEDADSGALAIPNDNTWYTVIVEAELTDYAEGLVDFAPPSTTITGTNTRFTDYLDETVSGRGTLLIIEDSGSGNDGEYEVPTISTDEALTLPLAPPAVEADLPWKPGAQFADIASPRRPVLARRRAAFSVVARVRRPAAGKFVLADVKRNDAGTPKIQIVDRRLESESRQSTHAAGAVHPIMRETAGVMGVDQLEVSATDYDVVGLTHTRKGGWLAIIYDSVGSQLLAATFDPETNLWSATVALPGAEAAGGDVVLLPPGNLFTHLAIGRSGVLRATSNNGLAWSSLGTPWAPGGGDTVETGSICLTRYGRLIMTGAYIPSGGGTGVMSVRYIYSDDYGTTWTTNGGAGFTVVDAAVVGGSIVPDVGSLFRVRPMDDGRLLVGFHDTADGVQSVVFCQSDELPTPTSTTGTTDHLGVPTTITDILVTPGRGLYLLQSGTTFAALQQYGDQGRGASAFTEHLRTFQILGKTTSDQRPKVHYNPITGEVGLAYRNTTGGTTEFRRLQIQFPPR